MASAWVWLWTHFHNHWVDPVTAIVAVLYAVMQHFRASTGKPWLSRQTGWDVLNGLALFPLMLLMGSTFSHYLTGQLLTSNKAILFGAGALALFAILEEPDAAPDSEPRRAPV